MHLAAAAVQLPPPLLRASLLLPAPRLWWQRMQAEGSAYLLARIQMCTGQALYHTLAACMHLVPPWHVVALRVTEVRAPMLTGAIAVRAPRSHDRARAYEGRQPE